MTPHSAPDGRFDALMAEVLAGSGGRFGHRQHVQLTWLAVRRHGMPAAIGLVSDGIRRTARYAGAPQKYHETISRAWVELIAHHATGHPGHQEHPEHPEHPGHPEHPARGAAGFAAFAAGHPLLLDKRLLTRFYHPATLASPAARTGWVEPDRAPFPWAGPRAPAQRNERETGPATRPRSRESTAAVPRPEPPGPAAPPR